MNNQYLGDGVYIHFDGYHLWLTTGTHETDLADNKIALEPEVLHNLEAYIAFHKEFLKSKT
jgi:hypothetical protein